MLRRMPPPLSIVVKCGWALSLQELLARKDKRDRHLCSSMLYTVRLLSTARQWPFGLVSSISFALPLQLSRLFQRPSSPSSVAHSFVSVCRASYAVTHSPSTFFCAFNFS